MKLLIIPVIAGLTCIGAALVFFLQLRAAKVSTPKMTEIGSYIALGVRAYLSRQLRSILLVTPIIALVLGFTLGLWVAVTFVLGVFTSLVTAYMGMSASTRANVKTADDATTSMRDAFHRAVAGGSIMGFSITGFSLVVLSILYLLFRDPNPLVGFGFGASLAALFAQIGGGIYTKAADIGADLVGKVEANIPEDDPRNPAVVADLVGDNVGDCAGRGSDLFQTFSDDIVTGMVVALTLVPKYGSSV
ncbi:MAG TPA: sodium/proton-translocating pyrophosphatase, partial [Candidatus Cryosericum sp.]